jgi:hypothetical protein
MSAANGSLGGTFSSSDSCPSARRFGLAAIKVRISLASIPVGLGHHHESAGVVTATIIGRLYLGVRYSFRSPLVGLLQRWRCPRAIAIEIRRRSM